MADSRLPEPHDDDGTERETEFSIARSNALIPLLVISALTVLAILAAIVRSKPVIPPEGVIANQAFGPADFPAVFGSEAVAIALPPGGSGDSALTFPVPAPPFSEGIFPCSSCHEGIPPNTERRELDGMHNDIVLHHDEEHRWCLDCHDANNRDQLRLASGAPVPFTESYRLCGQCHGTQYRDWRNGIHGKRSGYWNGSKRYLLCVNCHNPHSPHFASLQPLPPPIRPQYLRHDDAAAAGAAAPAREAHD
ncbi:MAG TPA: hypothetical protein VMW17_00395 [Candidatus Binatia bacterium]|nr:hypothetical protein [Candidatus Binatia bacterium]